MRKKTERILWGISITLIGMTIIVSHQGQRAHMSIVSPSQHPVSVMMFDADRFAVFAENIMQRDPFRLDRKPSDVSFGTPDPPAVPPAPVQTPYQSLALKGILGGPPWQAIFSGVPNRGDNVVARVGDTLAGLRVSRVRRDGVVLRGRDTLLALTLTRTWQ